MVLDELPVQVDATSDTRNDCRDWKALLSMTFDLPKANSIHLCKFVRSRDPLVARLHNIAVQSAFGLVKTTKQADMTVVLTILFL